MDYEKLLKESLKAALEEGNGDTDKFIKDLVDSNDYFGFIHGREDNAGESIPFNPLEILTGGGISELLKGGGIGDILKGTIFDIDEEDGNGFKCAETKCNKGLFGASNVVETEKAYEVICALPGASKNSIAVSVKEEILKVDVSVEEEKSEDVIYLKNNYVKEDLSLTFDLDKADFSGLKVSFKNGELKIVVPKLEVQEVFFDIK